MPLEAYPSLPGPRGPRPSPEPRRGSSAVVSSNPPAAHCSTTLSALDYSHEGTAYDAFVDIGTTFRKRE
jgi:hypothetical protein